MGHAVFKHPAVAGTVGDDLVQVVRVHALAQAQRHGLGGRSNVYAGQQLVDDLDLAAGTSAVAQSIHLGSHGVKQVIRVGISIGLGGGHHRHLAAGRARGAPRNGRVDVMQPQRIEFGLKPHGELGVHSRAHDKGTAAFHVRGATRAVSTRAKQHLLGLRRIDHHRNDHVTGRRQFGQRGACMTPLFGKCGRNARTDIKDMDIVSCPTQRACHARTHGTQTNQAHCRCHHSVSGSVVKTVSTPVYPYTCWWAISPPAKKPTNGTSPKARRTNCNSALGAPKCGPPRPAQLT